MDIINFHRIKDYFPAVTKDRLQKKMDCKKENKLLLFLIKFQAASGTKSAFLITSSKEGE